MKAKRRGGTLGLVALMVLSATTVVPVEARSAAGELMAMETRKFFDAW